MRVKTLQNPRYVQLAYLEVERKGFTIEALEACLELVLLVGHKEVCTVGFNQGGLHDVHVTPLFTPQTHEVGEVCQALALYEQLVRSAIEKNSRKSYR